MSLTRKTSGALIAPLVTWLTVGVGVPVGLLLVYSFLQIHLLDVIPEPTLANYARVFTTGIYRSFAINTLAIAGPAALLAAAGGFVIAYFMAFRAKKSRAVLLAATVIAFMSSYLALIYSWRTLSGEQGVFNSLLQWMHVIDHPVSFLLFSRTAVIVAEVHFFLPFTTLVLYSALSAIPPALESAARDLGASRWTAIRRIIIPLSGQALLGATLFVFFLVSGDYITPVFLGGVGSSATFGTLIADQINTALNFPLGAALAFVMLGGLLIVAGASRLGMQRSRLLPEHVR